MLENLLRLEVKILLNYISNGPDELVNLNDKLFKLRACLSLRERRLLTLLTLALIRHTSQTPAMIIYWVLETVERDLLLNNGRLTYLRPALESRAKMCSNFFNVRIFINLI